jgi:hypothetical protein
MQSISPLTVADFKGSNIVIGKIEIDNDGTGNYVELPDVIDFEIDTNIEDEVSRFNAYSFTITCLNTDKRYFSWNTASPYYGWLKQGRRIKIWAGIKLDSTDYYYQWIIGRVDSYSLSTVAGEEICTIEGRDFMRTVLDYKLYSPNTHWGTEMIFDTVANQADYIMPAAWDLTTVRRDYPWKVLDVSNEDSSPYGLAFSSDGSKVYMLGNANTTIYQYALTIPWDISTGSYDSKNFNVGTQENAPYGLCFSTDGDKVYIVGFQHDTVFQYVLSTAWDISTASYDNKSFDASNEDTAPMKLFFKPDGSKVYILGDQTNKVYQYSLSPAWDISTANYDTKLLDSSSEIEDPWGLFFSSDGSKVYIIEGLTSDDLFQYTLSTPWDVSTGSYDSVFFSFLLDTYPTGIFFKPDGRKLYVIGAADDEINQWTIRDCKGIYIAYLDNIDPYDGDHLFPIYSGLDFGFVESTNKFSFYADVIPSYNGTDNLVIYYFEAKSIESVVGDILYYAGIFATTAARDTWLADSSYVTPTGQEIDRVWFNTGTSAFEAIRLLAEVAQYRFYFDYAGNAIFKPKASIGTKVDTFSDDCITNQEAGEDINEVYNHIIVIGESRETLG